MWDPVKVRALASWAASVRPRCISEHCPLGGEREGVRLMTAAVLKPQTTDLEVEDFSARSPGLQW